MSDRVPRASPAQTLTTSTENEMHANGADFCTFREVSSLVMTWNAGASKPSDLRHDEKDSNFFRDLLQAQEAPDILVFGLQELVDLEDKSLTASKDTIHIFGFHSLTMHRNLLQKQK